MSASPTLEDLRRAERAARYSLILDAAIRLFARRSFFDVGMREIADEAGISPALIYRHFSGQQDLFLAVIERESDRLVAALNEAGGSSRPGVAELADSYVSFMLEHTAFFQMRVHYAVAGRLTDTGGHRVSEHCQRIVGIFRDALGGRGDAAARAHALKAALDGLVLNMGGAAGDSEADVRRLARLTADRLAS